MSNEPIVLNAEERDLIFQATGRRVASIVSNTRGPTLRQEIGKLSDHNVLGAFVSLKRQNQLRSCMGCLAESFPLADAIDNAAARAAKDDPRFPPIVAGELLELNMEVWILWGLKPCTVPARERVQAIEIGRHGIIFEKGPHRGLLLPGVAIEHKMDAVAFLQAGCQKAGLPLSAWEEDSVRFSTFEGDAISGPFYDVEITDPETLTAMGRKGPLQMMIRKKTGPTMEDVLKLQELCRSNFFLCAQGMTPTFFLPEAYEGNVSGISLSFQLPDRPLMVCSKLGVQSEIPLQSSLCDLVQVLLHQVESVGATFQERIDSQLDLTVFWDPFDHGPLDSAQWGGFDAFRRSLMVVFPQGWVLQFNPDVPIEGVLDDAVKYLNASDRSQGRVLSFETISTTQHVFASSLSRPVLGDTVRPAAVAGAFYPSDPTAMNAELNRMFAPGPITKEEGFFGTNRPQPTPLHGAQVPPGKDPSGGISFGTGKKKARRGLPPTEIYSAVMVPHAGWIYSGRLAAQTLARARFPESAIIFSPKHRPGGPDWAVASNRIWELPGPNVESDLPLAREIVEAVNLMQFDATAHAQEHAIEVQLPILAELSPRTKIVGIAMNGGTWDRIREGAIQLASTLLKLPQLPLLIISTDMNHYASEESTRSIDRLALDAIESLDPRRLLDTVAENRISMCGAIPAAFVLEVLRNMNLLHECVPVGYTTSAAASGDKSRVVGYAGMLFR